MMEDQAHRICSQMFETQQLVETFPPRLRDRNKKVVYRVACPLGCHHAGSIVFSRWRAMTLPEHVTAEDSPTTFEPRQDIFSYEPVLAGKPAVVWYLNFAHSDLFCAYGGAAFAQDEIQVAEHPALGSLREGLLASTTLDPLTVENGQPTPVLIRGVERRCVVATDRNSAEGRPDGLYGNYFSRAKAEVVERATRPLMPPTITNLVAMEAPSYGSGVYSIADIDYILCTAYSGFRAAKVESALAHAEAGLPVSPETILHTGFWGCGAYGGNRVLMALLQMLAAQLAQVNRLVFHTFDPAGSEAFETALSILDSLLPANQPVGVAEVLQKIHAIGFRWGTSDDN